MAPEDAVNGMEPMTGSLDGWEDYMAEGNDDKNYAVRWHRTEKHDLF